MKFGRVDNLDIYCSNLAEMVNFYGEVLMLPEFLPYEEGAGWAAFDAGNLTIYLFETGGQHAARRTTATEDNPPAIDSFAFEVDDLDSAASALEGLVRWALDAEERWTHPQGTWYRYRSFYDPEGNLLHITEPHVVHRDKRARPAID